MARTPKELHARLCELCARLYPDEWQGKYTGTREGLRDWLNVKCGTNACHITNKESALNTWINRLEEIEDSQVTVAMEVMEEEAINV